MGYNLKEIIFPNKQLQIRGARGQLVLSCQGKNYSVITVIICCAWSEGPEVGTSYGYVITY